MIEVRGVSKVFYRRGIATEALRDISLSVGDHEFLALLGDVPATNVVTYCGSGVAAAHNVLAMEVAGLPGARVYAGSWSEWCSDPARPVARQTKD